MTTPPIKAIHEAATLPRLVLIDANVFFSPRLRDLFMALHVHDILSLRWTRRIESEWTRNVREKHAARPEALEACVRGMRKVVPDWEVEDVEGLEWAFHDVSPSDRHVAAAAYQLMSKESEGRPVALITGNLRDFRSSLLDKKGVLVISPAAYLDALHAQLPDRLLAVADECRLKLKQPTLGLLQYAAVLRNLGCHRLPMALLRREGFTVSATADCSG